MAKVSFILPTRFETYQVQGMSVIQRTVKDIYEKATGEFEVIVAFDGPPYQDFPEYPNLKVLRLPEWGGIKVAINEAAKEATGKYLLKLDGHCSVGEGIDEILQASMEDNWVVTPRFYVLNAEEWKWQDNRFYDFFYLPSPWNYKAGFLFQSGGHWSNRTRERLDIPIDENMKLHGSSFFMTKDFYWNCLGGLDPTNGAGSWCGEDIEISMKTWLGPWGAKLMVNKNTWYAHMHRGGQRPREWPVSYNAAVRSAVWTAEYWMHNRWEKQAHDIEWLIDRFMPVPGWAENWKDKYKEYLNG